MPQYEQDLPLQKNQVHHHVYLFDLRFNQELTQFLITFNINIINNVYYF